MPRKFTSAPCSTTSMTRNGRGVDDVPGVLAVKAIRIGARAVHHMRPMKDLYVVPDDQLLCLTSDPRTPERGSSRVITEGGV